MAHVSHGPGDITSHPDVHEMRDRYARVLSGPGSALLEGMALLAGLYCAISPWTVHFSNIHTLTVNNLIVGIGITVLALGLAAAPERMGRLAWALTPLGVWLVISPFVVTRFPSTGMIATNVATGAVVCFIGLIAAAAVARVTIRRQAVT